MRLLSLVAISLLALTGCDPTNSGPIDSVRDDTAADRSATSDDKVTPPDNTAVNERDADGDKKTPLDQNQNQADIDLVAKIRQKVLDVKDLSVNGRNAKIIVENGKVTLRGPVDSENERTTIEQIARDAAGEDNVTSELEVAARP